MKPQSAKAKGRLWQQRVRDSLLGLDDSFREGDIESRSMGAGGEDIMFSPHARDILPISVECKSLARHSVYTLFEQAKSNCPDGSEPIVCLKVNNKKPVAILSYDYWLKLESKRIELEKSHGLPE